ncbi:hypothetical protein D3C84_934190 [compost metagenome]
MVRSGGIITPVTISASAFLKAEICAEKSSLRFWKRPGSTNWKPFCASTGGKPSFASPQALPSPSLGNRPPMTLLLSIPAHIAV